MAKPDSIDRLSVQTDVVDIFILMGVIASDDGKISSVLQVYGDLVKNWTPYVVGRNSRCNGIKAYHRKDHECAQTTPVFITRNALQCVGKKRFKQHTDALLGLPRCSKTVVYIRNREAWFVAHRELTGH